MADEKDIKNKEESTEPKKKGGGLVTWAIVAVTVVLFSGAGFVLGRLFSGPKGADESDPLLQASTTTDQPPDLESSGQQKNWYYDMDPVIANLNEPSVSRYVRVTLVLELSSEVDQTKGVGFIDEKKPILKNWLTIYLAGQSLEDIRGDRNLRRIQSQILDTFNEKLFPDSRPRIKQILFKEFAVQ